MRQRVSVHESEVAREEYSDRWSKDLIGGREVPTTSGFSLGVAEYFAAEFGKLQVHNDQEEVYVVSGVGQMRIGDRMFDVGPGTTFCLPPGTPHATRRTGPEPVFVVYAHAKHEPGKGIHNSAMATGRHWPGGFGAAKAHDDHEALYVIAGEGQIRVGDEVLDVRPGHAVYVAPGVPHATRSTTNGAIVTLFAHGAV